MTLPFSLTINDQPTWFINRIWAGLLEYKLSDLHTQWQFLDAHKDQLGEYWKFPEDILNNKFHTIREDKKDRWKANKNIHFIINNRTPQRFQFAPVLKVKSIQKIEIVHKEIQNNKGSLKRMLVRIDGVRIGSYFPLIKVTTLGLSKLAKNDGFDSVQDFYNYFNKDFVGKIIHWTDLKY